MSLASSVGRASTLRITASNPAEVLGRALPWLRTRPQLASDASIDTIFVSGVPAVVSVIVSSTCTLTFCPGLAGGGGGAGTRGARGGAAGAGGAGGVGSVCGVGGVVAAPPGREGQAARPGHGRHRRHLLMPGGRGTRGESPPRAGAALPQVTTLAMATAIGSDMTGLLSSRDRGATRSRSSAMSSSASTGNGVGPPPAPLESFSASRSMAVAVSIAGSAGPSSTGGDPSPARLRRRAPVASAPGVAPMSSNRACRVASPASVAPAGVSATLAALTGAGSSGTAAVISTGACEARST